MRVSIGRERKKPSLAGRAGSRYLEDDGRARLLLHHPVGAEGLEEGVGVVQEVGVVVDQQGLHVVEDEAKLVGVLHRVETGAVFSRQGRGEAAHGGGV